MDLLSGIRPELVLCRSPAVRVCCIAQRHPLPRYMDSITHKVAVNIRGQYPPYLSFPHLVAQPSCRVHKYPAGSKVITGTQVQGVFVLKNYSTCFVKLSS